MLLHLHTFQVPIIQPSPDLLRSQRNSANLHVQLEQLCVQLVSVLRVIYNKKNVNNVTCKEEKEPIFK